MKTCAVLCIALAAGCASAAPAAAPPVGLPRGFTAWPASEARAALGSFREGPGREFASTPSSPSLLLTAPVAGGTGLSVEIVVLDGSWEEQDRERLRAMKAWIAGQGVRTRWFPPSGAEVAPADAWDPAVREAARAAMRARGFTEHAWSGGQSGGRDAFSRPGGRPEWFVTYDFACADRVDGTTGESRHEDPVYRIDVRGLRCTDRAPGSREFAAPEWLAEPAEENAVLREILRGFVGAEAVDGAFAGEEG